MLTRYEALSAVVGVDYPQAIAEKAFIDLGLYGEEEYTPADAVTIDSIAINILGSLMVESVSEGGYSIKFNSKLVEARLAELKSKYNPSIGKPSVKALKIW